MRNLLIKGGLVALSLCLGIPAVNAWSQDFSNVYVTPRLIYSHQSGKMNSTKWASPTYNYSILGQDKTDDRVGFAVSAGMNFEYEFALPVRLELEYAYHGQGHFESDRLRFLVGNESVEAYQDFKVQVHTLMVNGFYDFKTDSPLTPYVGGGLGMSYLRSKYKSNFHSSAKGWESAFEKSRYCNFAWNVGGGLAYQVNDIFAVDIGYRYYDFGKSNLDHFNFEAINYSGNPSLGINAHEVSVGLRFSGF